MLSTELNLINELFYNNSSFNTIQSKANEITRLFKKSLKTFKQKDIEKYFRYLKSQNNSASTINSKLAYLSKCLRYYNVVNIIMPYQVIKQKPKEIITPEQFKQLRHSIYRENKELYYVILIAYYTGLRINEILNIRMQHIRIEQAKIFVNIYNTKNHTDNLIPINNKLRFIFKDFKEFTLNYKQVYYLLKQYGITAHQFRHTFITRCFEHGLDSYSVMKLTNQKSLSVQQRYVHITNKFLADKVNSL